MINLNFCGDKPELTSQILFIIPLQFITLWGYGESSSISMTLKWDTIRQFALSQVWNKLLLCNILCKTYVRQPPFFQKSINLSGNVPWKTPCCCREPEVMIACSFLFCTHWHTQTQVIVLWLCFSPDCFASVFTVRSGVAQKVFCHRCCGWWLEGCHTAPHLASPLLYTINRNKITNFEMGIKNY